MAIQQLMLGAGGVAKKTYLDDVFSTYLWDGSGSSRSINNGIDLSGEGGLVWIKNRNANENSGLFDTVRGAGKWIVSNNTNQEDTDTNRLSAFNNNGFSLGTDTMVNNSVADYSSWTFRKQKGFFDIVQYTGNSTNRTISHNLGCKPGMILFKNIDAGENWRGYHRELGATQNIEINNGNAAGSSTTAFNNTEPTSTTFSVGTDGATNGNGQSIVAYLFAGGESTAATASSTKFTGSIYLQFQTSSSDFEFGSSDFTVESWVKPTDTSSNLNCIISCYLGFQLYWDEGSFKVYAADSSNNYFINHMDSGPDYKRGQWHHVAVTRSGSDFRLFVNGKLTDTATSSTAIGGLSGNYPCIGMYNASNSGLTGSISNLRIVKGTALYTSSFRPPTKPLTDITNTKLLCCNSSSSATAYTVSPSTITSSGGVNPSADSPFDDPSGFKFGENGDQNIIKCGSYIGNGNADGPEIYLGFEPQFILVKTTISGENWRMWDVMRGINSEGPDSANDATLYPSLSSQEAYNSDALEVTSTGFKIKGTSTAYNGNGDEVIYMAIRRPDGYVGKPVETATDVFAMDTGNGSSTAPAFDSGFPVDMRIGKGIALNDHWYLGTRFMYQKHIRTDDNGGEIAGSWSKFDYSDGDGASWSSSYLGYMFKRHAGFDVVVYDGNGTAGHQIHHSLSKTPEMMWVKRRDAASDWVVYHKDLNSGSSPHNWFLKLNGTTAQSESTSRFGGAPSSVYFTVGTDSDSNIENGKYLALLFASVDGISKVGSYDGSSSSQTITTGFAPRFVILRRTNYAYATDWHVIDTTRGWGSGNDKYLALQSTQAEAEHDFGAPTSTGFTLTSNAAYNGSGGKYIYYAHA